MIEQRIITRANIHEEEFSPWKSLWKGIDMLGGPVNTYTHLDRAGTINPTSFAFVNAPLQQKWDLVDDIKRRSTVSEIYNRMVCTVERLKTEGTKVIGSFIDADPVIGDKAMEAADMLRKKYEGEIEFRFINQTLKGVIAADERKWFLKGAQWADIVGGLPKRDYPRQEEHLEIVLGTAYDLGKMAHIHVDQLNTDEECETELLAQKTIDANMEDKVVAVHSISLAAHPQRYREHVYDLMKHAGMMVISCPTAWINARRNERLSVTHNAIAPVDELVKHNIPVAIGSDNIFDVYLPYTNGLLDPEIRTLIEACHLYDTDTVALIATLNGRKVLGLDT